MCEGIFTITMKISKRYLKVRLTSFAQFLPLSLFLQRVKLESYKVTGWSPLLLDGLHYLTPFRNAKTFPEAYSPRFIHWNTDTEVLTAGNLILFFLLNGFWHQWMFFKGIISLNGSFPSLAYIPWFLRRH